MNILTRGREVPRILLLYFSYVMISMSDRTEKPGKSMSTAGFLKRFMLHKVHAIEKQNTTDYIFTLSQSFPESPCSQIKTASEGEEQSILDTYGIHYGVRL